MGPTRGITGLAPDPENFPMPRSPFRRRITALAAVTMLVSVGSGVSLADDAAEVTAGGGGPTTRPEDGGKVVIEEGSFEGTGGVVYLDQAAEATAAVKTQKLSMDMAMEGLPGLGSLTITSEGEFDNEAGQGHLTMDMGDVFGTMGESSGLPDDAGLIEMVTDGDTVYMKSSLSSMLGDDAKPWLSIDSSELEQGGALGGGAQSDPAAFPEEQLEGLGAATDSFKSIPAEAWVDADGFMRKFTMTFDFASAAEEVPELGDVSMTITVELYDFDEPVDIVVPDPSEVAKLDPSILSGGN